MKSLLQQRGYVLDENLGLWSHPERRGISYSDGDEEEARMLGIVRGAADRSVMSAELQAGMTDWPSFYHLTPLRSNLLRPIQSLLRGRVLEIGAGCGSVTRFIGESGANVLALEGSIQRGTIAAARNADLDNVAVLADPFDQFDAEGTFDVATLIGVLEYARVFFPAASGDPIDAMLRHARRQLRPGGLLLVAIENQMGMKYYAGVEEDHTGKPMVGIEDRYSSKGVITFGQQELRERIAAAGLGQQSWLFPFPDYKTPVTVLTEAGTSATDVVELSALLGDSILADRQNKFGETFSMAGAWKPIFRNGLSGNLANSFLVVASAEDVPKAQEENVLALHYEVERRPQFALQTAYLRGAGGVVDRQSRKLYPEATVSELPLRQQMTDEALGRVTVWRQQLTEILDQPKWKLDQLNEWGKVWFGAFVKLAGLAEGKVTATTAVPGSLLGAVAQAMVVDAQGKASFPGLEWELDGSVEAGYVVFRSLTGALVAQATVAPPAAGTTLRIAELVKAIAQASGIQLGDAEIQRYLNKEAELKQWLTGREPAPRWTSPLYFGTLELRLRDPLNRSASTRGLATRVKGKLRRMLGEKRVEASVGPLDLF